MKITHFFRILLSIISSLILLLSLISLPAYANSAISIATTSYGPGTTSNVGVTLTGFDQTQDYQVTVKFINSTTNVDVTNGTLAATQGSTSLISGYTSYSATKLGFSGSYSAIVAALSSLTWNPSSASGDISMRIGIATKPGTNEFYDANSGHYYRYVSTSATWTGARTASEATTLFGMRGYLAELTTAAENSFVGNETSASNIWIGATEDSGTATAFTGSSYTGAVGQRWIWQGAVETPLPTGSGVSAGNTNNVHSTVTNRALTSNVATLTTSAAHNLQVGDNAVIANVLEALNGTYTITDVPSTTTFRYAKTTSDVASTAVSSSDSATAGVFSSWSSNEPNNDRKPGQDCAVTNWGSRGNWNDLPCSDSNAYLMEFGGRSGETTTASITTLTTTVTAVTPAAPGAPTLNSVTAGDKRLTIAFTAGNTNASAITDYEYSLNGGAYVAAGTTTSPFTITGLNGRSAYSVTLKARNSLGLGSASSSLSATTTNAALDASEAAAAAAASSTSGPITHAPAPTKKQPKMVLTVEITTLGWLENTPIRLVGGVESGTVTYQNSGDTLCVVDSKSNLLVTTTPGICIITAVNSGDFEYIWEQSNEIKITVTTQASVITETKSVKEEKSVVVEQVENIPKMEHKVTFGQSAAWLNTKNIVALRNFISNAEEKIEIEKIVIKGFEQPTKIALPNIDIARANAVKKFLKLEGIDYPIVAIGAGKAKTGKPESSRIAIVIIEGKSKS